MMPNASRRLRAPLLGPARPAVRPAAGGPDAAAASTGSTLADGTGAAQAVPSAPSGTGAAHVVDGTGMAEAVPAPGTASSAWVPRGALRFVDLPTPLPAVTVDGAPASFEADGTLRLPLGRRVQVALSWVSSDVDGDHAQHRTIAVTLARDVVRELSVADLARGGATVVVGADGTGSSEGPPAQVYLLDFPTGGAVVEPPATAVALPLLVDPATGLARLTIASGTHTLRLTSPGAAARTVTLTVEPGEVRDVASTDFASVPVSYELGGMSLDVPLADAPPAGGDVPAPTEPTKADPAPRRTKAPHSSDEPPPAWEALPTPTSTPTPTGSAAPGTGEGWFEMHADPPTAQVTVDRIPWTAGPEGAPLAPGRHLVTVTAPGYAPFQGEVQIESDRTTTLHAPLALLAVPGRGRGAALLIMAGTVGTLAAIALAVAEWTAPAAAPALPEAAPRRR